MCFRSRAHCWKFKSGTWEKMCEGHLSQKDTEGREIWNGIRDGNVEAHRGGTLRDTLPYDEKKRSDTWAISGVI